MRSKPRVSALTDIVDENIRLLLKARQEQIDRRGLQEKIADKIGEFTGSMSFVYIHLILVGGWLVLNSGAVGGFEPWDPYPFVMLAMAASVEAIFLSTFVLINQNRQAEIAEMRADLDLQISLVTEHELTRLIHMVDAISSRVGVTAGKPPDLEEIKKDIPADLVLQRMQEAKEGDSKGEV